MRSPEVVAGTPQMSASAWLNRPDGHGRFWWRPGYEIGYQAFKGCVMFLLAPIYRVRRVGAKPKLPSGGVILCPNHASYLDPAFVQLTLRRRVVFIMTNDFYSRPRWRWFFQLVTAVPVGRGRLARKGIRRAMALVKRGYVIVLFPEGRLSRDGRLGHAQRGVARVARRTGAPVIPVGIAGAIHAWGHGNPGPGRASVRVAFGRPMRWTSKNWAPDPSVGRRKAEQQFADRVMARIAETKAWVQREAPVPGDVPVAFSSLQTADSSGR